MRRPLWSSPTALMKDTECPSILACAPKLKAAPPRCSVSPNTSHNTSPMLRMFMVGSPALRRAKYVEKSQNSKLEIRNWKTGLSIEFDFRFSSFDPRSVGAEILCWFSERCNRPVKHVMLGRTTRAPQSTLWRASQSRSALSQGERVDRDSAFTSRRGPGLRPPKGYGRSGQTARYGPQAGEGSVAGRGRIRHARPKLLNGNE